MDGRWRDEHDVEGPGAGTFITVMGLQVDGRWNDGVLTGAYLRQWGARGGGVGGVWAAVLKRHALVAGGTQILWWALLAGRWGGDGNGQAGPC